MLLIRGLSESVPTNFDKLYMCYSITFSLIRDKSTRHNFQAFSRKISLNFTSLHIYQFGKISCQPAIAEKVR